MSKTVFKKVDYDLDSLIKYIKIGDIGLPDIQRPFVWKNSKVRDLFDSMYKGYPIGYFLFWQNEFNETSRTIGNNTKQKAPKLVIVDGQQRLTSLYAVIQNISVLRENYSFEKIQIAFNPIDEIFEVSDAAIRRDPLFIPDISILWDSDMKITKIIRNYTDTLGKSKELSEQEEDLVEERILKLQGLLSFPLTALELVPDIDDEAVSHVFVRINSKGTPLNQSDFILTLMSVYWDEGRTDLEKFCRESRKPSHDTPSPFNYYLTPFPDQLLRVSVGLAFKRARMKYIYSILRGKDLKTEKFSDELRDKQFELLKDAQSKVLNIQYWHDFFNCVRQAGFRSSKMISSNNNLLFSYILYLIGRTEFKISEPELKCLISKWFFMSSLTRRYTDSPETAMESDFNRLSEANTCEDFKRILEYICNITLSNDFWNLTLPNDLATSSSRSPSLFAYQASLVLLDATALYSKLKISDLLDPSTAAVRSVEKHHLFPKAYLNKEGITNNREKNQIANYAYVEWMDNVSISDQSPKDYVPEVESSFSLQELETMYFNHALPHNWTQLDYRTFLQKRRELMAEVIAKAYSTLSTGRATEEQDIAFDLHQVLQDGENDAVEFKSTLRTNLHTNSKDSRMELAVLKTIAGFLNSSGGSLIIGVSDDGSPVGLKIDGFENEDKMALHLINIIKSRMGVLPITSINIHFEDYKSSRVLVVRCKKSSIAVFVKDGDSEKFFIRTGPSTTELSPSQTQEYIKERFR